MCAGDTSLTCDCQFDTGLTSVFASFHICYESELVDIGVALPQLPDNQRTFVAVAEIFHTTCELRERPQIHGHFVLLTNEPQSVHH